jgi:hypothetical protein
MYPPFWTIGPYYRVYAKNLVLTLAPLAKIDWRPQNGGWILSGYTHCACTTFTGLASGGPVGAALRVRQVLRSIRPLQARDLHRAFFLGIGGAVIVV